MIDGIARLVRRSRVRRQLEYDGPRLEGSIRRHLRRKDGDRRAETGTAAARRSSRRRLDQVSSLDWVSDRSNLDWGSVHKNSDALPLGDLYASRPHRRDQCLQDRRASGAARMSSISAAARRCSSIDWGSVKSLDCNSIRKNGASDAPGSANGADEVGKDGTPWWRLRRLSSLKYDDRRYKCVKK